MRFIDSSFQSNHDDGKSVSRYSFTLNDGAIYLKSFEQNTMANSICNIKCIAASDATKEAMWLWKFIDEHRVAYFVDGPVLLYYTALEP